MSLHDATQIVSRLGPSTILIDCAREAALAQELMLLGCIVRDAADPQARGAVGVVRWPLEGDDRVADRVDTLVVASGPGQRPAIEGSLFGGGWSRHAGGMIGDDFAHFTAHTLLPLAYFARSGQGGLLTRGDEAADAAIARFAFGAESVRSGDHVLVAGDEASDGVRIVAATSRARSVVAAAATDEALAAQPPTSFDVAIVMVADASPIDETLLIRLHDLLKRDGRLVLGWRDDGRGAAAVADLVDTVFISERLAAQRVGVAHRSGALIRAGASPAAGDWAVLVASANPLVERDTPAFRHPAFHAEGQDATATLVDIAGAYDNPHLYRVMVQLGERLGDEVKLARLAECVLEEARPGSADRGAAIAVLGYRVLDRRLGRSVAAITGLIEAYLEETAATNAPHALRWRLSLLFLAGRLAELAGDAEAALGWFERASLADWAGFSPLLATKAVGAAFHAARLRIASGDHAGARACFRRGLDTALAAAVAPHDRLIGNHDNPVPFYCQEMAEVFDMGAQCAAALTHFPLLERDAGLFWRQIDVKRFGLFAWADGLARENARLRAA